MKLEIDKILALKDGTRVILTQTGDSWEEEQGMTGICVKIGNRLIETDIDRPNDDSIWYPYYSINELDYKGYECDVRLEIE